MVAKNAFERARFRDVAQARGGCVRVHVVDLVRPGFRVFERNLHGSRGAFAILGRRGHVIRVR